MAKKIKKEKIGNIFFKNGRKFLITEGNEKLYELMKFDVFETKETKENAKSKKSKSGEVDSDSDGTGDD